MNKYTHILELLSEKKAIFKQAHLIGENLYLIKDVDAFNAEMQEYTKSFKKLESINEKIQEICEKDPQIKQLISKDSQPNNLSQEMKVVYEECMAIRTVVQKILHLETLIVEHSEYLKSHILKNVEKNNTGATGIGKRYYNGIAGTSTSNLRQNKNKWV